MRFNTDFVCTSGMAVVFAENIPGTPALNAPPQCACCVCMSLQRCLRLTQLLQPGTSFARSMTLRVHKGCRQCSSDGWRLGSGRFSGSIEPPFLFFLLQLLLFVLHLFVDLETMFIARKSWVRDIRWDSVIFDTLSLRLPAIHVLSRKTSRGCAPNKEALALPKKAI